MNRFYKVGAVFVGFIMLFLVGPVNSQDEGVGADFLYKDVSEELVVKHKGEILTDVLTFVGFNDNYDYWFAEFENIEGESLAMSVHSDDLAVQLASYKQGQAVTVKWKLGLLYEAGEGDAPYYYWRLISINE